MKLRFISILALVSFVMVLSGCTFFDEDDFNPKTTINLRGAATVNNQLSDWRGRIEITDNGGSYEIYSGTANSNVSSAPNAGVRVIIPSAYGESGNFENVQISFVNLGISYTWGGGRASLNYVPETPSTSLLNGSFSANDGSGNTISMQIFDAEVPLTQ